MPGDLTPNRPNNGPVILCARVAGGDLRSNKDGTSNLGRRLASSLLQNLLNAGEVSRGRTGEEMVKRQHAVGLTTTEVRLQLNHRVPPLPVDTTHAATKKLLQPLGDEGTAEEICGVLVLRYCLPQVHLPKISRKLRLLVVSTGYVWMRGDDFAPRFKTTCGVPIGDKLTHLATSLFLVFQTEQRHLLLFQLLFLGSRDSGEQSANAVQSPVGIIRGEGRLMRPAVAHLPQFADQRPFGLA